MSTTEDVINRKLSAMGRPPRRAPKQNDHPHIKDMTSTVFCWAWDAFFWMIGAGVVHTTYRQVPAIGFGTAMAISFFFGGASGSRVNLLWRLKDLRGEK